MDKYEYKLKLDQMKSLTAEKDYKNAAAIADTINWNKIKNVNALVKAGEIYENAGRYEESREILLMAYDRSPIGRMIIYRLAKVAIKMKSYEEAKDYYQEFVEIAPHDNLKYVLKYEICKAEGADIKTQIAILEELKEQEYTEEWAYELAYLYHKAGMNEQCVDACDELVLWFGEGLYVERALELKMLYQPLTKIQEEKYRQFRQKREGVVEVRPDDELDSGEIVNEPVQIPDVKLSPERFNTQNLQEELQRSMQQIMEATEKETVDDSMDNIKKLVEEIPYLQIPREDYEENTEQGHIETDQEIDDSLKINFKELLAEDYDGQIRMFVPERGQIEHQITGQLSIDEILAEWERTKQAAEIAMQEAQQRRLESAKARALQEAEDIMERLADIIPKLESGLTPRELLEEEYLGGSAIEHGKAAEVVVSMNQILQEEIDRLSMENAKMDECLAAAAQLDAVQQSMTEQSSIFPEFSAYEQMPQEAMEMELTAGTETEISSYEELPQETIEMELTDGIETEISSYEELPQETMEMELTDGTETEISSYEELPQEITISEQEEKLVLEESDYEDVLEESETDEEFIPKEANYEGAFEGTSEEAVETELTEQAILEEPNYEGVLEGTPIDSEEILPELSDIEEMSSKEQYEAQQTDEELPELSDIEEIMEEEPKEEAVWDENYTSKTADEAEETSEEISFSEAVMRQLTKPFPSEADLLSHALREKTQKLPPIEETTVLPKIEEPEEEIDFPAITSMNKDLREIFTYFAPIKGMEQQICQALTGAARHLLSGKTASTGNMIIQGGNGSGKTVLATSMVKALQKVTGHPNGRIGKIEASVLNTKDIGKLLKKVAGGCLIIEKAGGISREAATTLALLLASDSSGIFVIIEDTHKGIEKALRKDVGFASRFSEKVTIPIFTSDELVTFARAYAKELGYSIDEMGVLALYNSLSNIQKYDKPTTLAEVKEIMDKAIAKSEKGGLKKAFSIITSRRYDEEDYIILREKDFGI